MNLSIRARILLGFAMPIVLFVGFTFWLSTQLSQVKQNMVTVEDEGVKYALLAAAIAILIFFIVDHPQMSSDRAALLDQPT